MIRKIYGAITSEVERSTIRGQNKSWEGSTIGLNIIIAQKYLPIFISTDFKDDMINN